MGRPDATNSGTVFDVFLSHRYKSSDVNLHFYEELSQVSPITFRVDRGTVSTSTLRLERMIREADAFVGIFPIPGDATEVHDRQSLLQLSRYFRLEFDMAIRSRKPAAIFYDRRYGGLFGRAANIILYRYDAQDIAQPLRSPARLKLRQAAERFFSLATASAQADAAKQESDFERDLVGVSLPRDRASATLDLLSEQGLEPVTLNWPPRLDCAYIAQLRRCDWVILDTSTPTGEMLLAFLHGQFIPTLRIERASDTRAADLTLSTAQEVLFGSLEVGYRKDTILWHDTEDLLASLAERIRTLRLEPELLGDSSQAAEYFTSAARRKERVFLSYANEDSDEGRQFATELHKHFQDVFDYRAISAVKAGEPWMDQVFENLSSAAVGILLISASYRSSSYCMEEARQLYNAYQTRQLHLLPVKIGDADPPDFLASVQYERLREQAPADIINTLLVRLRSGTSAI